MDDKITAFLREMINEALKVQVDQAVESKLPEMLERLTIPGQKLSDLIDYDQASKILGISKVTLHSYIKKGKLTKYVLTLGGKTYLSRTELEKMLVATRKVNPNLTLKNYKRSA